MRVRRFRWLLAALVVCGLIPLAVVVVAARWLGPWLVVSEPLVRSDVIFVTDGKTPQRELEGAALFLEGWAPQVALTRPRDRMPEEVRRLAGEPTAQEGASRALRRGGVPEAAIVRLERIVDNTLQELQADFDHARAHGFRRVIIVSSPYHTRRIRLIWSSRFERDIPAIVRPTRYEPVDPTRWWRSGHPFEHVVHEVLGIANFLLGSPIPTFDRDR
jgi:uncharacterized SAM-binding protein YcdF (DUF218 family)